MEKPSLFRELRRLAPDELAKVEREVSAFDREPLGEESLLAAVRHIADAFSIYVEESRSPNGKLQLRYRTRATNVDVAADSSHYFGQYFEMTDGIYDYQEAITSRLAWRICGNPKMFQ